MLTPFQFPFLNSVIKYVCRILISLLFIHIFISQEAAALESEDPTIIFDLGLEYALQRQLSRALDCAKHFLDISSGAWVQGWRFFALLLTAQERHSEAQLVLEAAMEETSPWQQGPLLQTRAKVQMAVGQPLRAVHTYRQLLSLVQAGHQSFSFEAGNWQRNKVGRPFYSSCPLYLSSSLQALLN